MRYTSLGSGSEGNALLVERVEAGGATTRVMVDCGFTLKEVERRLGLRGVDPASLTGILVTHEHGDHIGGVFRLARRHGIPVHLTRGTAEAVADRIPDGVRLVHCDSHTPFAIQGLHIQPYPVPHDAREPVQFVFDDGDRRLGVLTDAGQATAHMQRMLDDCTALVLECNHCPDMLARSDYPYSLKMRIGGRHGHLSNQAAAGILATLKVARLRDIHAAHLSSKNNLPALAQRALAAVLGCAEGEVGVASQAAGFDWLMA